MKKIELNSQVPPVTFECTDPTISTLDAFKGQQVVLYFYPKDHTPGCTTESQDFRTNFAQFSRLNTTILGVSRDSLKSHQKFCDKLALPFPLISDHDEKICRLFAVLGEKNLYGRKSIGIVRSTFLIDKKGIVRHIWRNVKVPGHVDEVLAIIKTM